MDKEVQEITKAINRKDSGLVGYGARRATQILNLMEGLGYRKLPKDKPPLLKDFDKAIPFKWVNPEDMFYAKQVAQAQREADIKHYED